MAGWMHKWIVLHLSFLSPEVSLLCPLIFLYKTDFVRLETRYMLSILTKETVKQHKS